MLFMQLLPSFCFYHFEKRSNLELQPYYWI